MTDSRSYGGTPLHKIPVKLDHEPGTAFQRGDKAPSEAEQKVELGDISKSPVAVRYDGAKLRFDLIPPEWERALAHVLTKGAVKYAPRNWEKGMDWSRIVGSLRRHLDAWLSGETWDADTGAHHLCQVAWNALVLMSYQLRGIGKDDLQRCKVDYPKV